MPRPPKPPGLPADTVWRDQPRHNIPGSVWLPDTGYGALAASTEDYLRNGLARASGGDRARLLVLYCQADCWMSWNAAKRALSYGYSNIAWYPQGTDGWQAAGLPLGRGAARAARVAGPGAAARSGIGSGPWRSSPRPLEAHPRYQGQRARDERALPFKQRFLSSQQCRERQSALHCRDDIRDESFRRSRLVRRRAATGRRFRAVGAVKAMAWSRSRMSTRLRSTAITS